MSPGTLYLVGTPIGNTEDITLRALRILRQVPLVAAEDTRTTRHLFNLIQVKAPLTSFHEFNEREKIPELLTHLETQDLALVSDAGMPGLSDPGYRLVQAASAQEIPVVAVPGPSAVITALVVSGLPTDSFCFIGFLPRRTAARRTLLQGLAQEGRTLVAYEAPHRLVHSLQDIAATLGERPMAVARELTKLYEEIVRGTPAELIAHFSDTPPRGEITLVIGGAPKAKDAPWDDAQVRDALAEQIAAGLSPAAAAKTVAKLSGRPRRELYQIAIELT